MPLGLLGTKRQLLTEIAENSSPSKRTRTAGFSPPRQHPLHASAFREETSPIGRRQAEDRPLRHRKHSPRGTPRGSPLPDVGHYKPCSPYKLDEAREHSALQATKKRADQLTEALGMVLPAGSPQLTFEAKRDLMFVQLFAAERPASQQHRAEFKNRLDRLLTEPRERIAQVCLRTAQNIVIGLTDWVTLQAAEQLLEEERGMRRQLAELYRKNEALIAKQR